MLENTPLCQMLDIRYAILQGGMAWLGTSELVATVSEAGGLDIIGSGNAHPEWLREQINATRQLTKKPFGANIMFISHFTKENLKVVASENVKIVTFGGGNPRSLIRNLKKNNFNE